MLILGNLTFNIDNQTLKFTNEKISLSGVSHLEWATLDPLIHYGRSVSVKFETFQPPFSMDIQAQITREYTLTQKTMGLQFSLDKTQQKLFSNYATKHGQPQEIYQRKYPRIPASSLLKTFPLRALITIEPVPNKTTMIVFDIVNISPGGISLTSENQLGLKLEIGQNVSFVLDPRGWFPFQIQMHGKICRILDDFNPINGNTQRQIGIQFTTAQETDKQAFVTLLKDILEQIKKDIEERKDHL